MSFPHARPLCAAVALSIVAVGQAWNAAAQGPPTAATLAQRPGDVKAMADDPRGKLDTFLKQAVDDKRPEMLSVIIRPAAADGADVRVRELLTKLGLKVSSTLSKGRLLVVTLKAERLLELAASADIARVSFDALVKPQGKDTETGPGEC